MWPLGQSPMTFKLYCTWFFYSFCANWAVCWFLRRKLWFLAFFHAIFVVQLRSQLMNSHFYSQSPYYSAYFTVSTLGHVIFHILLHFTETRKTKLYFFSTVSTSVCCVCLLKVLKWMWNFIRNGNNYLWESKRLFSVYFTRSLRFGDIWHHAYFSNVNFYGTLTSCSDE